MSCGAAEFTSEALSGTAPAIDVDLSGDDKTRTFTSGSAFNVIFTSQLTSPDVLAWQIQNYAGTTNASGTMNVGIGATTVNMPCTSTLSGYFSVSAQLQKAAVTVPQKGSRPVGFASFGVLPDFSNILPAIPSEPLDRHRFGLEGTNYVQSGMCCSGNDLQPVNQNLGTTWTLDELSMALTEPDSTSVFNPTTWPLDVGLQQGTLARIITLNGIPAWASTAPTPTSVGSYPPTSFAQYQAYMALVGQNSVLVQANYIPNQEKNYYQVTTEPDPGPSTQWMGTDAQFVALYQAAWNGLHSTDPNAIVMGPANSSVSVCNAWLNRLAPLGLSNYLDAVACHGYYTVGSTSDNPPEAADLPSQMQTLRHTITQLLPAGEKLFMTETGISYPIGAAYSATYPTADVLQQQAEVVARTHLILLGEGADVSVLFYSADYAEQVGFGLYFNLVMQTVDFGSPNISPKPAAMATAAMTRLVDNTRTLGALSQMPTGSYGYSFETADHAHAITALWAHNASFNASVPFQLPVAAAGSKGVVLVIDGMGNQATAQYLDGTVQLTLSEMPTYVFSSDISALGPILRAPEGYSVN
jgi:hypothetical protein